MATEIVYVDRRGVRRRVQLNACYDCQRRDWTPDLKLRVLRCNHCGRERPFPRDVEFLSR